MSVGAAPYGGSQSARLYEEEPEPSLRLPMLPRTARILPQPPPEFASVYSRRSRNRYEGAPAAPRPPPPRSTLADTQAIASMRWKTQKTEQLEGALPSPSAGGSTLSPRSQASTGERRRGGRRRNVHNYPMWQTQKFREEHALREGRAIQDDRFWDNVKEQRRTKRPPLLAGEGGELHEWDQKVRPWVRQRNMEKKSYMQRRLRRARREQRDIDRQQGALRERMYKKGRKMLKDMDFLVERRIAGMDTRDEDWLPAHNDKEIFQAVKDKLLADKTEGSELPRPPWPLVAPTIPTPSHVMPDYLFNLAPPTSWVSVLAGVQHSPILPPRRSTHSRFVSAVSREKVYEIQQHHRKMLKELFLSMDDDGSGKLEEPEIKMLAISLGTARHRKPGLRAGKAGRVWWGPVAVLNQARLGCQGKS